MRREDIPPFREFEHTGDLGIEVVAASRGELFRCAAIGLASLLVEMNTIEAKKERGVVVEAQTDADLMHDLLAELLYLFDPQGFIWARRLGQRRRSLTSRDASRRTVRPCSPCVSRRNQGDHLPSDDGYAIAQRLACNGDFRYLKRGSSPLKERTEGEVVDLAIFAGSNNASLAEAVAAVLGVPLRQRLIERSPDGEIVR